MPTFLKEQFDKAGYKTKELVEGLLVVEDFLSKEDLDAYLEAINTTPEEAWWKHYEAHLKQFCLEKFGRDDVENLVAEGKYEVTQGWADKNLNIDFHPVTRKLNKIVNDFIAEADNTLELASFGIFQRMQEGVELKSHTDQHTDPSIRYAGVIYLNDNYVDGEIFWPNKNIEIKPKAGSLIVFPGTDEFHHGVRHVGKGPIRYVIPGFIKVKGFYEKNKY